MISEIIFLHILNILNVLNILTRAIDTGEIRPDPYAI